MKEHKWDGVNNGDDRQMMMTMTAKHSQVVTSRGTEHSLHIDQISSLHRCRCVARWRSRPCATWNASRGSSDPSLGSRGRDAGSVGSRVASWRRIRTLTRRSVSAGVIMRGGRCLKVWTKQQQVVSLSSAESELYAAVKTASWRSRASQRTWEYRVDCTWMPQQQCVWSAAEVWARQSMSMYRIYGYRWIRHEQGRHDREPS